MATISVSLPSDGQTIDAADYNVPINTIVSEINGGLDADNIEAGGVVPNALVSGTGTSWAWQTWTPTFANLSGGTLNYSKYIQIGKTVHFRLKYTLAGAGMGTSPTFTLPVAANSETATVADPVLSQVTLRDAGSSTSYLGIARPTSSTIWLLANIEATNNTAGTITSTVPFTWATTDVVVVSGTYEAA